MRLLNWFANRHKILKEEEEEDFIGCFVLRLKREFWITGKGVADIRCTNQDFLFVGLSEQTFNIRKSLCCDFVEHCVNTLTEPIV